MNWRARLVVALAFTFTGTACGSPFPALDGDAAACGTSHLLRVYSTPVTHGSGGGGSGGGDDGGGSGGGDDGGGSAGGDDGSGGSGGDDGSGSGDDGGGSSGDDGGDPGAGGDDGGGDDGGGDDGGGDDGGGDSVAHRRGPNARAHHPKKRATPVAVPPMAFGVEGIACWSCTMTCTITTSRPGEPNAVTAFGVADVSYAAACGAARAVAAKLASDENGKLGTCVAR